MTQPKLNHCSGNTWQPNPDWKYPTGLVMSQVLFSCPNHSRIMRETYFVKCDILQSVFPWLIFLGCGSMPLSSLCTYTLINLLPVENFHLPCNCLGMEKKFRIRHVVGQSPTNWVRGRLRLRNFSTVWSEIYLRQWVHWLICVMDPTFYPTRL